MSANLAPPLALAGALVLVTAALVWLNTKVTGFYLDETLIKQSAVDYTSGLPHTLLHDVNARATSRLYSLVISPLFESFHGDVAVRAARAFNALLFLSAALPAYYLASRVIRSRWTLAAASFLCVAVPWLTLTTGLFTENLAYPLFLVSVAAMLPAYRSPGPRTDLMALAAVTAAACTRTQLAALYLAYGIVIGTRLWQERPAGRSALGPWARNAVRRYPITAGVVLAAVFYAGWQLQAGELGAKLNSLAGTYASTTTGRKSIPSDVGISLMIEVLGITLGLGVVIVAFGLAWYTAAFGRFRSLQSDTRAYVVVSVAAGGALFGATLFSQGGYLGAATEERYYFYAAPLIVIAGLAAVDSRMFSRRAVGLTCALIGLIALVLPIPRTLTVPETPFFAPAMGTVSFLVTKGTQGAEDLLNTRGATQADVLGLAILGLALVLVTVLRRAPRRGPAVLVACGAVAQIGLALFSLAAIDGRIHGVDGRVSGGFSKLGFIDRAVDGRAVTWVDNQPRTDENQASNLQRWALLYNDQIRQRVDFGELKMTPDDFPLSGLPLLRAVPTGGEDLRFPNDATLASGYVVQTKDSPLVQLAGRELSASLPEWRLQVVKAGPAPRLEWKMTGLNVAGGLAPRQVARFRSWSRATVVAQVTSSAPAVLRVKQSAGASRATRLSAGTNTVRLSTCEPASGRMAVDRPVVLVRIVVRRAGCA